MRLFGTNEPEDPTATYLDSQPDETQQTTTTVTVCFAESEVDFTDVTFDQVANAIKNGDFVIEGTDSDGDLHGVVTAKITDFYETRK